MNKSEINTGLAINITGLEGFFIVSAVDENTATLYSIVNGDSLERPIDDIEYAVNSGANSMNVIPLDSITETLDAAISTEEEQIAKIEEELRKLKEHVQLLSDLKVSSQAYYQK